MSRSCPRGRGTARRGAVQRIRALSFTVLLLAAAAAAQETVEIGGQGLAGVTTVVPGDETTVYVVELRDNTAGARDSRLGTNLAGTGIRVIIEDLTAATGLVAGDLSALRLYRSADNAYDAGDILLGSQPAVVTQPAGGGVPTLVDATTVFGQNDAERAIPEIPAAPIFFLVRAAIAAGATQGHAFRLGVAGGHIDVRELGAGGGNFAIGGLIAAADGDRIEVGAGGGGGPGGGASASAAVPASGARPEPIDIPFGGTWTFAVLALATGAYLILAGGG